MFSRERLVILDADGTTIDAFSAIEKTFAVNNMDIGNLERFQKRHHLFKYLGGIKEFPFNLHQQISRKKRERLLDSLTEVYREEAVLYSGMAELIKRLQQATDVRVGVITRNITRKPLETLERLFSRQDIDPQAFDFFVHLPLRQDKISRFREIRERFSINPALAMGCGDEIKDYEAALQCGIHCLMASYGFESYKRLHQKYGIPREIIVRSPEELRDRLLHSLALD